MSARPEVDDTWPPKVTERAASTTSDTANGIRVAQHFGQDLLCVPGIGWHVWTGENGPWRYDPLAARKSARALGRVIAKEAAEVARRAAEADGDARAQLQKQADRLFSWSRQSEMSGGIDAALRQAEPLLATPAERLDSAHTLLGCPNGVLDLATGELRAHRRGDFITKVVGVPYDPAAEAPTFVRVVTEIAGGNAELVDYLQRLCGYALSGARGEHLLLFFYGSGANGKSTFLGALLHVLGDYAGTAAPGLLIQKQGSEHPTGMADLQGKRLVVASESGETGRLNEEQVKALTGGDPITARRMRQDYYTFWPTHLLVLQTNHRPRVTGTDEGIWRRIRLLPFEVTVPPEKRDPFLPDKLRVEAAGILNWCLQGWRRYMADGFNTPEVVRMATAAYRSDSDQVGAFLSECCDTADGFTVSAADLYGAYKGWCDENSERPMVQRTFGMRLAERGFDRVKYGTGHRWRGIRLIEQQDTGKQYQHQSGGW